MESIRDGRLRRDSQIKGLYEFEKTLGKGHFAIVKLAKHLYTGEMVAIKVIDKSKLDEVSRVHLYQEVACMKMVKHENIIQLYEVIDSSKFLYIVQELGDGGDMYDFLTKHEGGLPEDRARDFFQQIVSAITYCHDLHIVHRDLKPENVVLTRNHDVVKITDFGFSNQYTPGTHLQTSCGSLAYSAPEILLGDSYEAAAVDVWSLGVLLFMLVCGEAPFNEGTDSETLTMIMDCRFKLPSELSAECKDLVSNLLRREPSERLTLAQILAHPWMQAQSSSVSETGKQPLPHAPVTVCSGSTSTSTPVHVSSTRGGGGKGGGVAVRYPVITRDMITEEEHREIVDCMTTQDIADEQAIMQSLNTEAYDHISATYFLLAEKRLKLQHDERLKALGGASSIFGMGLSNNNNNNNNNGPQCAGRKSPLMFSPISGQNNNSSQSAIPGLQPQQQQSPVHGGNSTHAASSYVLQGAGSLSNRSMNGSDNSMAATTPGHGANPHTATMPFPVSARSGSNSFADEPIAELSERRNSEIAEKPKTQRSWSAGPGISTAILQQGFSLSNRDSASPSPPPIVGRYGGSSYESLAGTGSTSSVATRVPNREHLTIAPSYNRNILKEDVNKLIEKEQIQRMNLSVCESDIPNLLLVPSTASSDSVLKSKLPANSAARATLQSSRLSEPHAGLGKLVEEEGESELDDFEDGGTGPFLGGARTSRGQSSTSRFKGRNHSLGTLFSRKQSQPRRLSAGHSPEGLRRIANSGGVLGSATTCTNHSGGGVSKSKASTSFALSRRSTPTRSHYNSDESGGEDADNRLRNISRFSESDRSLGYSHRQSSSARHSFNQFSDDSSVERPALYSCIVAAANSSSSYPQHNALLSNMERNDLSGSSNSTPNNRRHRRKKKSLNEGMKMSNLSVSSIVSNISSKYPIDPTNNTPSDSDSVSSRKTSSYNCNKLAEQANSDLECASRLVTVCEKQYNSKVAANLIHLVEEESLSTSGSRELERPMISSSIYRKVHENSLSSESAGTHVSLEGRPNVKCEYNKFNEDSQDARKSSSQKGEAKGFSSGETRKRRRKTRRSRRAIFFASCMRGSVDVTNSSTSTEEKVGGEKVSESHSLLSYQKKQVVRTQPSNSSQVDSSKSGFFHDKTSADVAEKDQKTASVIEAEKSNCKRNLEGKKVVNLASGAGDNNSPNNSSAMASSSPHPSRCCGIQ